MDDSVHHVRSRIRFRGSQRGGFPGKPRRVKQLLFLLAAAALPASAHDTWVQLNVAKADVRQLVTADLMLGNHGNNHRDFQLASTIPLDRSTLDLIAPDGKKTDLKPTLVPTAAEEKEGFWTTVVTRPAPGLYCVAHTYDAVVTYAPKRVIKAAKAFFLSGDSASPETTFSKPIGHALEIVPLSDPTNLSAGDKLNARILFKGEPLKDVVVSCIPRGKELDQAFDPKHEAKTNDAGEVELPIPEPNVYLVVVHVKAPQETGETYSAGTDYAATLTLQAGTK